ncbi:isovaleryl-CoA dehydrogenase [Stutzerimonas stutzeri]|uniref:Isovaleryl-CoA dehydrogenase n=1 Tax=Stutzerimonas stutzeri TaxID=316 RepID=W8QTW0_STUST|nr:acyl-CoA dehydrogenase family protein [Stutzerimonas stutzeri]AHL73719.1 isovaleryl-CoA dehydrogenase [Stutzerimonas stutzeri]MCQ4328766.1 acyl-CoA/acyl-ACP dehydrogenase [Stutzerimonas stutzeri]
MDYQLPARLNELQGIAASLIETHIAPEAAKVDQNAQWPAHSMKVLGEAGLLGLQVPTELGGHGQGLLGLSVITETIGRACPSSALCFGMHCVGTAVIAAKATQHQQDRYLRAIAEGRHITTLALSEHGTGAHFYLPQTRIESDGEHFTVTGTKQFVTNGGHADSYVVSTVASDEGSETGDFSCLIVDGDSQGMSWLEAWSGFGMRGNSSRPLRLDEVSVPVQNLLGEKGDQVWYVFEVVAPFFLMAMAGTYLGIAQSALDAAGEHLRARRYTHSGESLRDVEALQIRYAEMWTAVEKTRALIREAARRGDMNHPDALPFILSCKADAGETAVMLTNEAMTICGGAAYRGNSRVAQMLRDARAAHVMSPTTDLLKLWTGRSLLGLPLL